MLQPLSPKHEYSARIYAEILSAIGARVVGTMVREVLGCNVGVTFSGGGFTVITKECPQRAFCRQGGFIETACSSYTRGLLSKFGDFKITSDISTASCRQEFNLRISSSLGVKV